MHRAAWENPSGSKTHVHDTPAWLSALICFLFALGKKGHGEDERLWHSRVTAPRWYPVLKKGLDKGKFPNSVMSPPFHVIWCDKEYLKKPQMEFISLITWCYLTWCLGSCHLCGLGNRVRAHPANVKQWPYWSCCFPRGKDLRCHYMFVGTLFCSAMVYLIEWGTKWTAHLVVLTSAKAIYWEHI